MSRVKWFVAAVAWIALSAAVIWQARSCNQAGPATPNEAIERVKAAGLNVITDRHHDGDATGLLQNFTVSAEPLTREAAAVLSVNSPPAAWKNVCKVYGQKLDGEFGEHLTHRAWGKVWLLGDPDFVERIMAPSPR